MNEEPRILLLTLSFGSGHVRASQTIAEELKHLRPDARVSIIDALECCRWWFHAFYVTPYWVMVRHFPRAWRRLFETRVKNRHSRTAPEWVFRFGCSQVFDTIGRINPDVIVAVEVAACEMAAIAKREGLTGARLVSVITDHEAEPVWVKEEVDSYAVADETVRQQLILWGAPQHKVEVTGIAVDASFAKSSLGLSQESEKHNQPIVLLMGGGMGPTRMDQVVELLCKSGVPMELVAVAGHDRHVQKKLGRVRAEPPVSLRVLGWADDVAGLMQAATLLVTKPGGLTISEAAFCGLPVILFDALPGPEQRNAAHLASEGAASITSGVEETVDATISLLRDEQTRCAMSQKVRQLSSPDAAANIARIVLGNGYLQTQVARAKTA
jgi:processive 1,2-diacylglycerol beta-glucosyltransferase